MNENKECGSEELVTDDVADQTAKEVQVRYQRVAPSRRAGQGIHLRRELPPVPAGKHVPDNSPSPPVEID